MEVKIVLGTLWGDEGKGNTVQWLCRKALEEGKRPCVVRFSGGPQAGHTVVHNGITHVCSSFGSGVLLGVPTIYIGGFIDPLCVENERKVLEGKGVEAKIYAMDYIPLITPYDVYDQQQWAKEHPNHTCGKGVYSAVRRFKDLWVGDYEDCWGVPKVVDTITEDGLDEQVSGVWEYYRFPRLNPEVIMDWEKAALKLGNENEPYDLSKDFDVLIFEGTQGLLLDPECGFYPFTTSTKVGLNGVPEEFLKNAEVYLVTRTYLTRHGEMSSYDKKFFISRGPFLPGDKLETNTFNKFQGEFRTSIMSLRPVEMAVYRHHLDNWQRKYRMRFNLAVTHMDIPNLYPSAKETVDRISLYLSSAGLKLSDVYGAYGPDSNFKLLNSYDN